MNPRHFALIVLALPWLTGCGRDTAAATAATVLDEFQAALRAGDADRCRTLVTSESAAALDTIPWAAVRKRQPLAIQGVERDNGRFRVRVTDPNDGGRAGEFLVVREYGRLVVDLVATAGLTAEELPGTGHEEFVPRELTPRDIDRIRQIQLAKPPGGR